MSEKISKSVLKRWNEQRLHRPVCHECGLRIADYMHYPREMLGCSTVSMGDCADCGAANVPVCSASDYWGMGD